MHGTTTLVLRDMEWRPALDVLPIQVRFVVAVLFRIRFVCDNFGPLQRRPRAMDVSEHWALPVDRRQRVDHRHDVILDSFPVTEESFPDCVWFLLDPSERYPRMLQSRDSASNRSEWTTLPIKPLFVLVVSSLENLETVPVALEVLVLLAF